MTDTSMKKNRRFRWLWILAALFLVLTVGVIAYLSDYYHASKSAFQKLENPPETVEVLRSDQRIVFSPEHPSAGLIFYPGGKVEFEAYTPLLEACAENGILCVLPHMPGNLAVLDENAADGIAEEYPEIHSWYLAGHSLGGTIAAIYAEKHPNDYSGLILLASYSTKNLSESGLKVLSMYGSEDGVMNRENYAKNRAMLPSDAREIVIDGGCHAYFGSYGEQAGDGAPKISQREQQRQTVSEIVKLIEP